MNVYYYSLILILLSIAAILFPRGPFNWYVIAFRTIIFSFFIPSSICYCNFLTKKLHSLQQSGAVILEKLWFILIILYMVLTLSVFVLFFTRWTGDIKSQFYRRAVAVPASFFYVAHFTATIGLAVYFAGRGVCRLLSPYTADMPVLHATWGLIEATFYPVILAAPFVISFIGLLTTYDYKIEHVRIRLPKLKPEDRIRIVQAADIHYGIYYGESYMDRIVNDVNRLEPDLFLITGDILTHASEQNFDPLLHSLKNIDPEIRTYFCLGNHDLKVSRNLTAALKGLGIETLINEKADIRIRGIPLQIGGLEFYWPGTGKKAYPGGVEQIGFNASCVRVLMAHDPGAVRFLEEKSADLILSGHLHGGQIGWGKRGSLLRLLGIPDQGLHRKKGMLLYINRGTGHYGFPLRIGVSGELTCLELTGTGEGLPERGP